MHSAQSGGGSGSGSPRREGGAWSLGGGKTGGVAFNNDKQRILESTDIVRLIGDALALKPKGREYVGLCPFHNDHKPSMAVVPHKQIYHCFSCGAGGDALSFVMNYYKMTFREALQLLADRAGVKLSPSQSPRFTGTAGGEEIQDESASRASLLNANTTACGFFRTILQHAEHGVAARAMIQKRSISPEMVELFQLGAAPDRWDGLALTVANIGIHPASFIAAGLFKVRDGGGGHYDAFRNRLMFPIQDQLGRVIAFGARKLNEADEPKYLNSSDSPLFNKSTTLYGLHQASQQVRSTRIALVTEGYMDTIACHQAGLKNAVATLGTALTAGNARILRRLCDTVVLLFDGDVAGQRAAERAVEVFFAEPIDVRIATLSGHTDAKDPDELLKREGGVDVMRAVIAAAIDPLDLLFSKVRSGLSGQGLSTRTRVLDEFLAKLLDLGLDRVEKIRYQLIVRRLAEVVGLDYQTVSGALGDKRAKRRPGAFPVGAASGDRELVSEVEPKRLTTHEHLLGCVLCDPVLLGTLDESHWEELSPNRFAGMARAIALTVHEMFVAEESPTLQGVLGELEDVECKRVATALAAEVDRVTEGRADRLRSHWADRLRELRNARAMTDALPVSASGVESGDRAAQSSDTTLQDAAGRGWDTAMGSLERLREVRATLGQDQRAMPRPSS